MSRSTLRAAIEIARCHLSFFTILPVGCKLDVSTCLKYVDFTILTVSPVVLLLSTGITFLLYKFTNLHLVVSCLLMYLLCLMLTGFIHLDGFTDVIDALFTHPEKRLQVLKDPHVGAMGVCALIILLTLGSVCFMTAHSFVQGCTMLIISELMSRTMCSIAARLGKPLTYGLCYNFILFANSRKELVSIPLLVTVFTSILLLGVVKAVLVVVSTLLLAYAITRRVVRALGGVNGDVLGFSIELSRHLTIMAVSCVI